MKFMGTCNLACWECNTDCEMKQAMVYLPEPIFCALVLEAFESTAGFNITSGVFSKEEADKFVKEHTVAIYIARQKYLEALKKSR